MRALCLILLCHASLQLQCDKSSITAHIRGEFILSCTFDISKFRFSKKYWCRGSSRHTCEILVDSDGRVKGNPRVQIVDAGKRGLFVKVMNLQFDDSGVYWVGIDAIYADTMTSVDVVITEVPVSKPRLQPVSSLVDRPTCWGQPMTVRCSCTKGTSVQYEWFQHQHHEDFLLYQSSDLYLHCGTVETDSDYYCIASNDISTQRSDILSVQVLAAAGSNCIYVVRMQGQPIYDCADRMSTTAVTPAPLTSCQAGKSLYDASNQSLPINKTDQDPFFYRPWMGVPFWYSLLRWSCFASLLIILCAVLEYSKVRRRRAKRKRRVRVRRRPQFTH